MRTKVLLAVDVLAGTEGGTEQHLLYLLRKLPRERLDLRFVVLGKVRQPHAAAFAIEPMMLGEGCRSGFLGALQRARRLAGLIRREQIDVVHAFCRHSECVALLATRWAGRGVVLGVRRNVGYWHTRRTLWQARLLQCLGAHYAANSQAGKEFAVAHEWIRADRVRVIRNPLSADRLAEGLRNLLPRSALGLDPRDRVVGIVATLRPIKDHPTFLRAAAFVLREHPQTKFLVAGMSAPDMLAELQALARSLRIDGQVVWLGGVPNPLSILPHCDVAVLSSRSEGFSNALLEYAAAGVATVATHVGGNAEIVQDGQTGFLVPPGEPAAMAQRICQLLSDDALRQQFATQARRRVETEFSEEQVLEDYTRLYFELA